MYLEVLRDGSLLLEQLVRFSTCGISDLSRGYTA